jgi:DNA-directed RNA polymerase specialized sigma24 family protein
MNKLKPEKQKQIIASLIEGNSIRATCRMTDTAKGTVLKLLADIGKACKEYQDKVLRNLSCKRESCQ